MTPYAPRLRLWVELPTPADVARVDFDLWRRIVDGFVVTLPGPENKWFRPVLAELDSLNVRYLGSLKASPYLGSAAADPAGAQLADPRNYVHLGDALREVAKATGSRTVHVEGESVLRHYDPVTKLTTLRALGGGGPLVKPLAAALDAGLKYLVYPAHTGVCAEYGQWLWAWRRTQRWVRAVHEAVTPAFERPAIKLLYLADAPAPLALAKVQQALAAGSPEVWLYPSLGACAQYGRALLEELPT